MAFLASLLAIFGFVIAFLYLKIVPISKEALSKTQAGAMAMLNTALPEEEKELAIQSAGLTLLKASFNIFWRLLACFVAAAIPIYLIDIAGLTDADHVMGLMLRWDYIIGTTLALIALFWAMGKFRSKDKFKSAYSSADQLTHKLAFSGPGIQLTASDIEDRIFSSKISKIENQPPIFITSLPRAGTTILLNALNDLPFTATHLYRDMPFVMSPLLWSSISKMFIKEAKVAERAHGDGIKIGYDSPEAFEEIIWKVFWPEKYKDDCIELWTKKDEKQDATEFFINHFKKIVSLRTNSINGRYISKNNANIARLDLIPEMFPDSHIIVPLRKPLEHAASLQRQHMNFLKMHDDDPFTKSYMEDIGHLEFGKLHKPIAFENFNSNEGSPEELDYWLDYWIAAYEMVSEKVDRLHLVTLERLGTHPQEVMNRLCEQIDIQPEGIEEISKQFRPVKDRAEKGSFNTGKLDKATAIYNLLLEHQI